MPKTHINSFLFIIQIIFVNSVIFIFLFNFHRLPQIYNFICFLFLIPLFLFGLFLAIIFKYFKPYRAYRDLILITLGASTATLWMPMLIGIYSGAQEFGKVLKSKKAFNIQLKDIPQNNDAIWMTFDKGILRYDYKMEYHEITRNNKKSDTKKDITSYYIYPLVSSQWTADEAVLVFFCEEKKYNQQKNDHWDLPILTESDMNLAKKGGLVISDEKELKMYSRALLKLLRLKDLSISEYTVFIKPYGSFEKYYLKYKYNFYFFIILVNLLWVGTTGVILLINRKKTRQYVTFDFMK